MSKEDRPAGLPSVEATNVDLCYKFHKIAVKSRNTMGKLGKNGKNLRRQQWQTKKEERNSHQLMLYLSERN